MPLFQRLLVTRAPASVILIRLMVGGIFVSEGIQKFLYPSQLAAGRFERIGLPAPELLGPFVAGVELVFGLLVILGLATRLAVLPLLATMAVAMLTTKVPILVGSEWLGFEPRSLSRYGFWAMMHESRNDLCMVFGSLFLLVAGGGRFSADARLSPPPEPASLPPGR